MHLTTKLFFTATLLAGNLFASFAGDVTLKITKKYINLPVSHQVDRKKMTFEVKGTPERNFVSVWLTRNPTTGYSAMSLPGKERHFASAMKGSLPDWRQSIRTM